MGTVKTEKDNRIRLRKSDLLKSFAIWETTSETCLNFERLMSLGFCHAMTPILKRLYPNKKDLADGLTRHLSFFNTENNWGALIPGIIASMEEERANGADISDETINAVKTGLMGPLAGIGDTITQGLAKTMFLAIGIDLALKGNLFGPFLFLILYTAYLLGVGYTTFFQGYKLGRNAFSKISDKSIMRKITDSMCILGMTIAGSMVATYVHITTPLVLSFGETQVQIQALLDQIMPNLLNLCGVTIVFMLLQKNKPITRIMLSMVIIGIIGAAIGIL